MRGRLQACLMVTRLRDGQLSAAEEALVEGGGFKGPYGIERRQPARQADRFMRILRQLEKRCLPQIVSAPNKALSWRGRRHPEQEDGKGTKCVKVRPRPVGVLRRGARLLPDTG